MAITTRLKSQANPVQPPPDAAVDAFISGAPDAAPKLRGVKKGNRQQISLTIAPALLMKLDKLAEAHGLTRSAAISMAIHRAIEAELSGGA
ncbi:CopG family transcriptional regulator [Aromatoleum bremense]|uniref:CopG family transcriptional regulator n=1 Tax=Aromatoleum bremense TaxID=76115 RepID=A0ABX1P065_9RHOO|nr:CopG family transcriptional regulator [Aromatoleum bremense]NMG17714.1 CopG family transcriptional regulator [Aromatoleum bremense]